MCRWRLNLITASIFETRRVGEGNDQAPRLTSGGLVGKPNPCNPVPAKQAAAPIRVASFETQVAVVAAAFTGQTAVVL